MVEQKQSGNIRITTKEVAAHVAQKVKEQSETGKLIAIDCIGEMLSDIEQEKIVACLPELLKSKSHKDIKTIVTSTGAVYLYSETYISESRAEQAIQNENYKFEIANKVREDSKNFAKLTGIDSLISLFPEGTEASMVEATLSDMQKDERFRDISTVAAPSTVYLYSTNFMTKNYAEFLVRAKAEDKCVTIATSVREEARIYPRPTSVEFFKNPIFNINPNELEGFFTKTLATAEFKDIKLLTASTGARYLYSDLYLSEARAKSLIEWEEVGRFDNP